MISQSIMEIMEMMAITTTSYWVNVDIVTVYKINNLSRKKHKATKDPQNVNSFFVISDA